MLHSIFLTSSSLLLITLLISAWTNPVHAGCEAHNPAFPLPTLTTTDPFITKARDEIEQSLKELIKSPGYDTTSFSIEVTARQGTLFELHHTARQRDVSRPGMPTVDGTTRYRIGSLTKAFTALSLLQQERSGKIRFHEYIDKFIPELKQKQNGTIPWFEIPIWSIATQMSGIPRDLAMFDLVSGSAAAAAAAEVTGDGDDDEEYDPASLGLPTGIPSNLHWEEQCGFVVAANDTARPAAPCTRANLINYLQRLLPLFPPKQQSTYSNMGYSILALALENVTGLSYETLIQATIIDKLGLNHTSFTKPSDSLAALSVSSSSFSSYWDQDLGILNPSAGLYSSSTDMAKFIRTVLSTYNGISLSHNWIFPVSFATGMNTFYGLPWEIYRTDRLLPYTSRPVTFVTKLDLENVGGYEGMMVSVPDYDFGFTVLTAGTKETSFARKALDIIAEKMVLAADEVAHEMLRTRYTGTWITSSSSSSSSSSENSSSGGGAGSDSGKESRITISHSKRLGGLYISQWIANGVDVLSKLGKYGFPYVPKDAIGASFSRSRTSASASTSASNENKNKNKKESKGKRDAEGPRKWYLQLVPTLLYLDATHSHGEIYKMIGHPLPDDCYHHPQQERVKPPRHKSRTHRDGDHHGNVFADFCATDLDRGYFAGLPVNELGFWNQTTTTTTTTTVSTGSDGTIVKKGRFERVELVGFRMGLDRITDDREDEGENDGELVGMVVVQEEL